jgi:hypothetical protein
MTFTISVLILARESHIKPDSEAGGLIWVEGWYQGRYRKFHVIIYLSHILHWLFSSIDFYIAEKIFELTNCDIFQGLHRKHRQKMGISRGTERVKRLAFVQLAHIFVSSLVSKLYQTMSICTMTLESVCKIYPRRCHLNGNSYSSWRIHLS